MPLKKKEPIDKCPESSPQGVIPDQKLILAVLPSFSGFFLRPSSLSQTPVRESHPPSESSQFEAQNKALSVNLEQLEMRNKILAAGLHDVNNLLVTLNELCSTMDGAIDKGIVDDKDVIEVVQEARLAVERTIIIAQQCMTANRVLDKRQPPMSPVILNISDFLTEVRRQININFELINPKLCSSILADPNHFSRVLINLLRNARLHSKDPNGTVEIIFDEDDDYSIISVRDGGVGLPKETVDLFDSQTPMRISSKGFGIGLASCKLICEAHGGYITAANNEDGPGAIFTIRLPQKIITTMSGK